MSEQQDDTPSIDIQEKPKVIEVDVPQEQPQNEDDPRAAIYAKAKHRRNEEAEGTPVGSAPKDDEKVASPPNDASDDEIVVKVNGKERKVPKSKIDEAGGVQAYQKAAAAAEELRIAKEERRRVQEIEAQLAARERQLREYEQQIQQRATQQPASSPPANTDEMKQLARQYHEAILDGDTDKADELLIQLQGARSATPDVEAIARRAATEAKAALEAERRAEMQWQFQAETIEAQHWFNDEFSDIAEDPELREWADQKTLKIMRENPSWRPKQIIEEAARQVRDAIGKNVTTPPSDDKLAAKRALTNVRGGSARAVPRPTPKPQTHSQYVEQLRKQRGLE